MSSVRYPGCHGFLVEPPEEGLQLGWSSVKPPRTANVIVDELPDVDAQMLWRSDWPAEGDREATWEEAWREPSGSIRFVTGHRPTVHVNPETETITLATSEKGAHLFALASSGLTTLAQFDGAIVLHACAASRNGKATLICALSGSGKSTLLLALAKSGWETLSDDLCVIDPNENVYTVWPGPSWVRINEGDVPESLNRTFSLFSKNAWSLDEFAARQPAEVSKLVLLEPPGGNQPEWAQLTPAAAVPLLSDHAAHWISNSAERGRILFPRSVRMTASIPTYRMRLPWNSNWQSQALELLDSSQ